MNSTAEVTIMLFSPDNFFNPELNERAYIATLDENSAAGSTVLIFSVTDADLGPASELGSATILGSDAEFFRVNVTSSDTGIITST